MFFPVLDNIFENAKTLAERFELRFVIDEQVKQEIIRLNTEDQLRDKGIDSLNKTLGNYSRTSVNKFGKRPGHIQLLDTGEFYASFTIAVTNDQIIIVADTIKEETDLSARYGIDILGLTEDNIDRIIREYILENYLEYVLNALFQ
jgi:hypothetical protein